MNFRNITLTPQQPNIAGRYRPGDIMLCLCDASDGPFTIYLPDARQSDNAMWQFVYSTSSDNKATLRTIIPGQKIDNETTYELVDKATVRAAAGNFWIVTQKYGIWA